MEPVLIVGGGIAGLTAALALAKIGRPSIVLERAAEFSEVGAGLQISPNAASVLCDLDLGDALDTVAEKPDAIVIRSGKTGRTINRLAVKSYCQSRFGHPYRVAHRADLLNVLKKAADDAPLISLHVRADIGDIARTPDGIRVVAADRRSFEGAALIAADGVWSAIRVNHLGQSHAIPTARTAWRATVPATALADTHADAGSFSRDVGLWMGPSVHLVHYPLRGGAMINLVAVVEDLFEDRTWDGEGGAEDLARHFQSWCESARALIDAASAAGQEWRRWPLYQARPEAYETDDPIVLVGDAWHATLPFMAQGAAMAIEDAAVLARCMADEENPVRAFKRFQRQRLTRTARLVDFAQRNGRIYHLRGPMAFARDTTLSALSSDRLLSQLDWIYGWKPPALT